MLALDGIGMARVDRRLVTVPNDVRRLVDAA
jgi:hypothetical protein